MEAIINGIHLSYTDEGHGMPVVFLHAFPLSKAMWQPQIPSLVSSHRVITLDLRGHGESEGRLWNDTLDDYAGDVIGLLEHLHIPQATFIGLSMGGYILFSLVRHFRDRIKALVLADTRAEADTEEAKAGRQAMLQTVYKEGNTSVADTMLPKLLTPATLQNDPAIVQEVRNMILGTPTEGIMTDLMAMAARPDSTDLLSTITCPTLIIVGEQDVATPLAASQFMAERISGSELATIPHAGHLSNIEQPAAFNQSLQQFLGRQKR